MPNPYADAIAALSSGTLDPENARRVMAYVYGLPALIEAMSQRIVRDGRAYAEDFPSEPEASAFAVDLGTTIGRLNEYAELFGDVFERVHAPDIKRLDEPRNQERKWDYSHNQE